MNGTIEPSITDRIYLDTNALIEAFEGRGRLGELMKSLLTMEPVLTPQRFVTSELTHSELLVKPFEMDRHDLINVYDNWTISNPYIEVVPVIREVLHDAAIIRARDRSLKLPDAIHLATAQGTHCRYFLTRDSRIRGQYGVEIALLNEANVEALLHAKHA